MERRCCVGGSSSKKATEKGVLLGGAQGQSMKVRSPEGARGGSLVAANLLHSAAQNGREWPFGPAPSTTVPAGRTREIHQTPPMHAADEDPPWPRAGGLLLGRYELLGVIGRGGMGVVSKARDVHSGELVAVKRVRAEGARAEREAMASAQLRHPAIVRLIEAEADSDGWIIVSELVEGADLRAVLRTGDVPELDIARFAGSIVRGLAHAHQHGVVHRDVKPANILCPADPRRAGAWAKLTDFGVAALAGAETLTAVGDVVGTMAYMAPEQARGDRAGAPADVFALAVVVYEALAGVNPRRGNTAAETAARALSSMPPLSRHRPDLPAAIHGAIDFCLELDPAQRGGLADLDDGLRRLAALATGRGAPAPTGAHTSVTRLADRPVAPQAAAGLAPHERAHAAEPGHDPYGGRGAGRPGEAAYPPMGAPQDAYGAAGATRHRATPPQPIDPRGTDPKLVPYLPEPGHEPIGDPHGRSGGRRGEGGGARRWGRARGEEPPAALGRSHGYRDDEPVPQAWAGGAVERPEAGSPEPWPEPVASRGRLPKLPLRILGTAGAAAALFVLTDGASAPVALAGIAAAALVLPRLTWIAIALTAVVLLTPRDETAAWLAAVAGLAPLALLPGRAALWPAGGLAAGLTAISAPAAWPALAALAPRPWLRVGLAVQGALVASVVATATSVPLLDVPRGDILTVGTEFVLPLAAIWAIAAVLLGLVVRGRTFGADVIAAATWTSALGGAMVGARVAEADPLLWAGPAAAAAIVVVARGAARSREVAVQAQPY